MVSHFLVVDMTMGSLVEEHREIEFGLKRKFASSLLTYSLLEDPRHATREELPPSPYSAPDNMLNPSEWRNVLSGSMMVGMFWI